MLRGAGLRGRRRTLERCSAARQTAVNCYNVLLLKAPTVFLLSCILTASNLSRVQFTEHPLQVTESGRQQAFREPFFDIFIKLLGIRHSWGKLDSLSKNRFWIAAAGSQIPTLCFVLQTCAPGSQQLLQSVPPTASIHAQPVLLATALPSCSPANSQICCRFD